MWRLGLGNLFSVCIGFDGQLFNFGYCVLYEMGRLQCLRTVLNKLSAGHVHVHSFSDCTLQRQCEGGDSLMNLFSGMIPTWLN